MPPSIHPVDLIATLRNKHLTPAIVFLTSRRACDEAMQTFEPLQPWSRGWGCVEVDAARVEIEKPEQKITLLIPAPPSDQDLLRR